MSRQEVKPTFNVTLYAVQIGKKDNPRWAFGVQPGPLSAAPVTFAFRWQAEKYRRQFRCRDARVVRVRVTVEVVEDAK